MTKTEHEQLSELMSAYGEAVDSKDYDGIAACFLSDAVVHYQGYSLDLKGHGDIKKFMKGALGALDGTQHLFMNFVVSLDGDAGRFSCGGLAQHWRNGATGGDTYLIGGKYENDVRRTGGQWKIARMSYRALWANGNRSLVPEA